MQLSVTSWQVFSVRGEERSQRGAASLVALQLLVLPGNGCLHGCMALLCAGSRCQKALLLSLCPAALLGQRRLILLGVPGGPTDTVQPDWSCSGVRRSCKEESLGVQFLMFEHAKGHC